MHKFGAVLIVAATLLFGACGGGPTALTSSKQSPCMVFHEDWARWLVRQWKTNPNFSQEGAQSTLARAMHIPAGTFPLVVRRFIGTWGVAYGYVVDVQLKSSPSASWADVIQGSRQDCALNRNVDYRSLGLPRL